MDVFENEKGTDKIKLADVHPGQFGGLDERYVAQSSVTDIPPGVLEHGRRDITGNHSRRTSRQRHGETPGTASEIENRGEWDVAAGD